MNPVRNSISGNRITHSRVKHGLKEKTATKILSNGMKIVACIPARFGSTRFPGKVLAKDTGKFLIQHVYERACRAKLIDRVIIAADDRRIIDAAKSFGAECVLTSVRHKSGTDRIAEAIKKIEDRRQKTESCPERSRRDRMKKDDGICFSLNNNDIVVNLQADEPEIDPANIDFVARLLIDNPDYPMATLAAPFQNAEQIADPNIVKVVVTRDEGFILRSSPRPSVACRSGLRKGGQVGAATENGRGTRDEVFRAIYFSRSPIPYDREKAGIGNLEQYLRHIGIYAYHKEFLLKITSLPQTPLEKIEKLEQLRAIENGFGILVGKAKHTCDGIDTPEQYAEFVKRYSHRAHRGHRDIKNVN